MKNLYCFIAHIDDFELGCLAYILKNHQNYQEIVITIASTWKGKEEIWRSNYERICEKLGRNLTYKNLRFEQRQLMSKFDDLKEFYSHIDFSNQFDILTHDVSDDHTDHWAVAKVAQGMFKYANKYVTIYSPSTRCFSANLFIRMTKEEFDFKKSLADLYTVEKEQSYTKLGYYLQSNDHYNIGRSYLLESSVRKDIEYCEVYCVHKDIQ